MTKAEKIERVCDNFSRLNDEKQNYVPEFFPRRNRKGFTAKTRTSAPIFLAIPVMILFAGLNYA
jgi:hypothetical protein